MAKSSLTLNKSSSRSLINTKKENPNAQFSYAPIQAKTDVSESENQDLSGYKQPQSRDIMENVTASPEQISNLGIQAKLTIGQPNDQYEQEADQVASQVVQQINTSAPVQRQEQGEEELQTKSEIQRQTDEEELQTKSEIQRQTDEEELQTKLEINPVSIQRKIGVNQLQQKPLISMLQRREAVQGGEASTDLESSINNAKSGGQSLDIGLQRSMGQAMGADFSGVRVHTDSNADQLSQSIQAKAFTTGNHIFMKQGEYNPSSQQGQELLAHELTHVVQQNGGAVQRKRNSNVKPTNMMQRMSVPATQPVIQRNLFSFLGLGRQEREPDFVPQSDTTAITKKNGSEKIVKAMTQAYKMVKKAEAKISIEDARYKEFMDSGKIDKANADNRVNHVKAGFEKIKNCLEKDTVTFKNYALKDGEEASTYAYVIPANQDRSIYLGGAFWKAKAKGYDSQPGTIIHELSHELHGTKDHKYGLSSSKKLAKTNPQKATTNADNYEHFAEEA